MANAIVPQEYQDLVAEYQQSQAALRKSVELQQQYDAQLTENTVVKEEFDALKEGETVYRLSGGVMVRQDKEEALSTVNARLQFIKAELAKAEASISAQQKKQDDMKNRIIEFQAKIAQQSKA